jgi:hypothetical protein
MLEDERMNEKIVSQVWDTGTYVSKRSSRDKFLALDRLPLLSSSSPNPSFSLGKQGAGFSLPISAHSVTWSLLYEQLSLCFTRWSQRANKA